MPEWLPLASGNVGGESVGEAEADADGRLPGIVEGAGKAGAAARGEDAVATDGDANPGAFEKTGEVRGGGLEPLFALWLAEQAGGTAPGIEREDFGFDDGVAVEPADGGIITGVIEPISAGTLPGDAPVFKQQDLLGEIKAGFGAARAHDDADAMAVDCGIDDAAEFVDQIGIEAADGFIDQQESGLRDQGAGGSSPKLEAREQLGGIAGGMIEQAGFIKHCFDLAAAFDPS